MSNWCDWRGSVSFGKMKRKSSSIPLFCEVEHLSRIKLLFFIALILLIRKWLCPSITPLQLNRCIDFNPIWHGDICFDFSGRISFPSQYYNWHKRGWSRRKKLVIHKRKISFKYPVANIILRKTVKYVLNGNVLHMNISHITYIKQFDYLKSSGFIKFKYYDL